MSPPPSTCGVTAGHPNDSRPVVMQERLRAAVLLGALAGARLAESCGLRMSDVDFMRGIVFPRMQYPAEELKTKS